MSEVELVKQLNARASMTERLTGVKGDGTRLREAADTITRLLKERDEARAKTAIMLGVGDGHGSLFVYGDYDSIKAARAYIFRAEAAEAQVAALKALLASAEKFASDYMTEEWAKAARKALEASR